MTDIPFFAENQWRIVDVLSTPVREAGLEKTDDLDLLPQVKDYLARAFPAGIYQHQKEALRHFLAGEPVCLSTGTASGKSLAFQVAAMNLIARDPKVRVMAIYPMKALSNEQRDRWERALLSADLHAQVGRIDGNVPPAMRASVLERSQVVVFTPDIIHAWLFSNLNQPAVIDFLRNVRLVVVDEVHAYTGVFGSNAAYLFRRLEHLLNLLGVSPGYICASATIARPAQHLNSLFGMEFTMIGPELDSSPRFPLKVCLVDPPAVENTLEAVVHLLGYLASQTQSHFIAFVDSRKQVELITSILARAQREAEAEHAPEGEVDEESRLRGVLDGLQVLPYRAGYEENDRKVIQERLTDGTLKGVISTSALELGLDISDLDTCVLVGVPPSATSLQQRIGRIGRHAPGTVYVVNAGDVYDRAVFANPRSFFERPLAESALYLENRYIQYIHALCLARTNGENAQVLQALHRHPSGFNSLVRWPQNFVELCRLENAGQTPRDLLPMKNEGREKPNYTFPLREVESQFKVERYQGPTSSSLGSLSYGQLMREAYPGAIYYYATFPYRVTRVNLKTRQVQVRKERRYTTRPNKLPDRVFPRLNMDGIFNAWLSGSLLGAECQMMVRESINGIIEQRGGIESVYPYPLPRELGFNQDQPYFNRNYFTTGVMIHHQALAAPGVYPPALAELLYEAFLILVPFDRQDIGWSADFFRQNRPPLVNSGAPFLAIFDQTYGSLRLSARLAEAGLLAQVLMEACLLARTSAVTGLNQAGMEALVQLCRAALQGDLHALTYGQQDVPVMTGVERVILPESKGLLLRSNEEFRVLRIVKLPMGLCYDGIPASMEGSAASVMPQITDVAEIPGESQMGTYLVDTGELIPLTDETVMPTSGWTEGPAQAAQVDSTRLAAILVANLDQQTFADLFAALDLPQQAVAADGAGALASRLADAEGQARLLQFLLRPVVSIDPI